MKKKRWIRAAGFVLALAVISVFAGACQAGGNGTNPESVYPKNNCEGEPTAADPALTSSTEAAPYEGRTWYVRTNCSGQDILYPKAVVIRSVEELKAYYEANKDVFDLGSHAPGADTTLGFLDAAATYDAAYFEDRILVLVLLEEGSGSIRHTVKKVQMGQDGKLYISIRTIVPEVGTCDMAQWHIFVEPEAGVQVQNESDVVILLEIEDSETQPETVYAEHGFASIRFTLPYNWEYQTERKEDGGDFCIAFWPAGHPEGKIKIWHYDGFGVCGTGLKMEQITLGGYEAYKGTYDNKRTWDFIHLMGTPGAYVVMNEGADAWWEQYGHEAMKILSTVAVGENLISEADAIAIAEKAANAEYNEKEASFDPETGCWTVALFRKNTLGGDQVLTITSEGKIVDVKYGE